MVNKHDEPIIIDYGSCQPFGMDLITAGTPGWVDEVNTSNRITATAAAATGAMPPAGVRGHHRSTARMATVTSLMGSVTAVGSLVTSKARSGQILRMSTSASGCHTD